MIKKINKNESGNVPMVNAAIYLIVIITILYIGLNINQNVIDASSVSAPESATVVFTSTTNLSLEEWNMNPELRATVNISTEQYEFRNSTGEFFVNLSGNNNDSAGIIAALVTEINVNSTLVSAVDNGDNTATITSTLTSTTGNAYASTENATGQAFSDVTLGGGTVADELYTASQSMDNTTESSYGMAGIMPIVLIAVAILASLLGLVYLFR